MAQPIPMGNFTANAQIQANGLAPAIKHAQLVHRINQSLAKYLPPPLKNKIFLVRFEQKTAIFGAYSPAIVFCAKQQKQLLLEALRRLNVATNIELVVVKPLGDFT